MKELIRTFTEIFETLIRRNIVQAIKTYYRRKDALEVKFIKECVPRNALRREFLGCPQT